MDNHKKLFKGDSTNLMIFVGGLPDLTLYTCYFTLKHKATDPSALISKIGIVSDPSSTYVVPILTTDTSLNPDDYCYDVRLDSSTAVHTIIKDIFTIMQPVKS
jgi:hypothetical protein